MQKKHDYNYYNELKTYKLTWEDFKLGSELTDLQRMVYNPCIMAKQEIVYCDGKEIVIVKVTEDIMDILRSTLSFKNEKLLG